MKIYDKHRNYMKLCENVIKIKEILENLKHLGNTKEISEIMWKCKKNYENVLNRRKT